jgi:hypothetical protein
MCAGVRREGEFNPLALRRQTSLVDRSRPPRLRPAVTAVQPGSRPLSLSWTLCHMIPMACGDPEELFVDKLSGTVGTASLAYPIVVRGAGRPPEPAAIAPVPELLPEAGDNAATQTVHPEDE